MGNGTSGVLRKTVDRAGFFRWGADSVKRLGGDFVDSVIEHISEKREVTEWFRVADEKAFGTKPRLYFAGGSPYFIVKDQEQGVSAYAAACPEEGGFLEWREYQKSFYCPFCQSLYDREGNSRRSKGVALTASKAQVVDGHVWLRVERPAKTAY